MDFDSWDPFFFVLLILSAFSDQVWSQEIESKDESNGDSVSIDLIEFDDRNVVEFSNLTEADIEWLSKNPIGSQIGLPSRPGKLPGDFTFRFHRLTSKNPTAMLGTYSHNGSKLTFTSRFPLKPATTYRALYIPEDGAEIVLGFFDCHHRFQTNSSRTGVSQLQCVA